MNTQRKREREKDGERTKIVVIMVIKFYILYEYKREFFIPRFKRN